MVAQAQFCVDEVKVVLQARAVIGPQEGLAAMLVLPGLVASIRFQGREDADQAGVMPALVQVFLHPVFLAEVPFADEHDLQALLGCQSLDILAQGLAQRLSKAGIVKNSDLPSLQVSRHALR